MRGGVVEVVLSALVLLVAAVFLVFAYRYSGLGSSGGYIVTARFTSIGGLKPGDEVQVAGVIVGSISSASIDPKTYRAVVAIRLQSQITLPADTRAVINAAALAGEKYLKLEPGSATEKIRPGGELTNTESPQEIEEQLGRYIFGSGS